MQEKAIDLIKIIGFTLLMGSLITAFGYCSRCFAQEPPAWSRTMTAKWTANTDADLLGYRVYQNGVQVKGIPAGTQTVTLDPLTQPGHYEWFLTAIDYSMNESDPSATISMDLDDVKPDQPIGFQIEITQTISVTTTTPPTQ